MYIAIALKWQWAYGIVLERVLKREMLQGYPFKLCKRNCLHRSRAVCFSECVIDVSN